MPSDMFLSCRRLVGTTYLCIIRKDQSNWDEEASERQVMYSQAALGPSSIYLYEAYWFVWFRTTGSECAAISTDDKVGCNGKRTSGTTESRVEAGDFCGL